MKTIIILKLKNVLYLLHCHGVVKQIEKKAYFEICENRKYTK